MDFEELITLYGIHSYSYKEDQMIEYLISRLCDAGMTVYADGFNNIYGEFGESETYPCIVAHMDEVHKDKPDDYEIVEYKGNLFGFSEQQKNFVGIGADDKNGIWIALKVVDEFTKNKKPIRVAFFTAEEFGCVGSSHADLSFFKDCRFVLQCDRRGGHDFINKANGLTLNSKEYRKKIAPLLKKYGYSDALGMSTDVYELKVQGLEVSVANIACGYYNPHTNSEMTNKAELENCLKMVLELMDIQETFPHKAEQPKPKYGYYDWSQFGYYKSGKKKDYQYEDDGWYQGKLY